MAKIFKVSGYILDANGEYSTKTLTEELEMSLDVSFKHLKVQVADVEDWDDNHPLNYFSCHESTCEEYFKESANG